MNNGNLANNQSIPKNIIGVLLKLFNGYKKESNLITFKNSVLISAILIGGVILFNLNSTMFNTVRVELGWFDKVGWAPNLKITGINLLLYVGIIFGIVTRLRGIEYEKNY